MPSIRLDAVSGAILTLTNIIGKSWIFTVDDPANADPTVTPPQKAVYSFWHTNLLPLFYYLRKAHPVALVSSSRDGQRLSAVLERWGYTLVRGSSSRGGASAVQQSAQLLETNPVFTITPDGPRGPASVAKTGAAKIALLTNACVVPVSLQVNRAWHTRSWDRFTIPKPFARIHLSFVKSLAPESFAAEPDPAAAMTQAMQRGLTA